MPPLFCNLARGSPLTVMDDSVKLLDNQRKPDEATALEFCKQGLCGVLSCRAPHAYLKSWLSEYEFSWALNTLCLSM